VDLTLAEEFRVLGEIEQRIQQALEGLEKRLEGLPAQTRGAPEQPSAMDGDIDDVTASFRRALSEALDRKLEELMAPVISLRHLLADEARALAEDPAGQDPGTLREVLHDAVSKLEKILRGLGGTFIHPEVGEFYDPLIHLAVGEAPAPGEEDGVVAEVVQPGYRSGRGRVVLPARVLVGRR
jgi:molecular chaperone GrpE (heat shock protein)